MTASDLDALIRRVDEDRWLASRFAPAHVRAKLIAIYAVDHELARIPQLVREPAAGVLRLAWWRDALADIHAGRAAPPQPALQGYARFAADTPDVVWTEIIEGRAIDVGLRASWAGFDVLSERTIGAVFKLAIEGAVSEEGLLRLATLRVPASVAWGYVTALRANGPLPGPRQEAIKRAKRAYAEVQELGRNLPRDLFPAIGFVTLAPLYLNAFERGRSSVSLLRRQLRLVTAAATGRL